jgi:hypothetical protein
MTQLVPIVPTVATQTITATNKTLGTILEEMTETEEEILTR